MIAIGSTIGSFRIEALLGQGGMGEVYLGYDPRLERRVAIKTIRAEQRFSGVQKARFLREARLLSRLGHPAICQVYDLIETPAADFLVLEYIDGQTLGELSQRETLSVERILDLGEKVALALAVAHREQVVHRDLKADNVMVTPGGEVKVLDFGIARSLSDPGLDLLAPPPLPALDPLAEVADDTPTPAEGVRYREVDELFGADTTTIGLTREGVIIGSLQSMSPEQAAGGEVTTASDLYSLGVLLQTLLTGEPVYEGHDRLDRLAQIRRAQTRPLPAEPGFDPDLVRLLHDLQNLDPRRRPTAEGAAEQLRLLRTKPQRLRRRRLRRQALSAAFVVLVAGLAVVSWLAYEATQARREAERRRRQAEGLIGFMLGDLRTRLEKLNRLDLLDAVGDRALTYFGELTEGELTRQELTRRIEAVIQIGEVRYSQGNLAAALVAFRRARLLAEQLLARDPQNPIGLQHLATAQDWIGQALYDLRRIDESLEAWRAARAVAQGRLDSSPNDAYWLSVLSTSQHNIGTILELRGDLDGALREYRESLARKRILAERSPENAELQAGIAATLSFVSNTLERKGDLAGAEAERRSYLAIQEALAAKDPSDPVHAADFAVAEGFLAGLLAARGEVGEARRLYESGLGAFAALGAGDPDNAVNQRWLGAFHSALGALPFESGPSSSEAHAALGHLEAALRIDQDLVRKDGENPDFRLQLGVCLSRLARVEAPSDPRRALGHARQATATLAPLAKGEVEEPTSGQIAAAWSLQGRLESASGDPSAGKEAQRRALEVLAPIRRPLTYWKVLLPWTEAEIALGASDEARSGIERLRTMGYSRRTVEELERALSQVASRR